MARDLEPKKYETTRKITVTGGCLYVSLPRRYLREILTDQAIEELSERRVRCVLDKNGNYIVDLPYSQNSQSSD